MLDTNLWSYLASESTADALHPVLEAAGHKIVIPPLMLREVLDTSDAAKRDATVRLMCHRAWKKLPSEIDLEAEELTAEIRRLRPEWLRSIPKTDRLHSFRDYWSKVYWREATRSIDDVIARRNADALHDNAAVEIARVQAANKAANGGAWPFAPVDFAVAALSAITSEGHPSPDPGAKLGWPQNTPVLLWRVKSRDVWWYQLVQATGVALMRGQDTTVTDFLGAYVNVRAMLADRASFNRFFLFDMQPWRVSRQWWRGTLEILQLTSKLGPGNPADAAHASNLPDCDYFLTADRRLANMLNGAAESPEAPVGGAAVLVKHAQAGWLASLLSALATLPPRRHPTPVQILPLQEDRGSSGGNGSGRPAGNGAGSDPRENERKRSPLRKGSFITTYDGGAALATRAGVPIADRVHVHLTDRAEGKPSYARSAPFYGEMWVDEGDLMCESLRRDPACSLRWLGLEMLDPNKATVFVRVHSWSEEGRCAQLVGEGAFAPAFS